MNPSARDKSNQINENEEKRQPYIRPAIVYQGKITIRAGSSVDPAGFGPPSPFDFPDSN